jgi:hypothetical protein
MRDKRRKGQDPHGGWASDLAKTLLVPVLAQIGYAVYIALASHGMVRTSETSDDLVEPDDIGALVIIFTCVIGVVGSYLLMSPARPDDGFRLRGFVPLTLVSTVLIAALGVGASFIWLHLTPYDQPLSPKLMDQWGTWPFTVYLAGLTLAVTVWGTLGCYLIVVFTPLRWPGWLGIGSIVVAVLVSVLGYRLGTVVRTAEYMRAAGTQAAIGLASALVMCLVLGIAQIIRRRAPDTVPGTSGRRALP